MQVPRGIFENAFFSFLRWLRFRRFSAGLCPFDLRVISFWTPLCLLFPRVPSPAEVSFLAVCPFRSPSSSFWLARIKFLRLIECLLVVPASAPLPFLLVCPPRWCPTRVLLGPVASCPELSFWCLLLSFSVFLRPFSSAFLSFLDGFGSWDPLLPFASLRLPAVRLSFAFRPSELPVFRPSTDLPVQLERSY